MGGPEALSWKEALNPVFSASYKLSMVVHTYNHIKGEKEAEGQSLRLVWEWG